MSAVIKKESEPLQMSVYNNEADVEKLHYETSVREAVALSKSNWTPKHLIGKTDAETQATCVGLVIMARKWDMAASMVAGETYAVHGKIGFQGKLYAALANAHGGLVGGLRAIYHGSGEKMACVVFGSPSVLTDGDKDALRKLLRLNDADSATELELSGVKAIRVTVSQCRTDQKMWTTDPEQKLYYTGSTKWCRRFMPDLVLGAISVEDIERIEYVNKPEVGNRTANLEAKLDAMVPAEVTAEDPYAKAAAKREARLAEQASSPQDS